MVKAILTLVSFAISSKAFTPLSSPLSPRKSYFCSSSPQQQPVQQCTSPTRTDNRIGGGEGSSSSSSTQLHSLFSALDKAFEEEGPLGKGITVGKLQVAISVSGQERTSPQSIFSVLEKNARSNTAGHDDDYKDGYGDSKLSKMCHEVCLTLLRSSDQWTGACSESTWFKGDDSGKAESLYNQWADREASKFEKEYIPEEGSVPAEGNPTVAVVSIIVEIQGDETNFDRAGFSIADTKSVLTSIASDCRVEGGDCLNAVEVFWTPSEYTEVLTERDTIFDFPELISF